MDRSALQRRVQPKSPQLRASRWLVILLGSSFGLVVCSWIYLQASAYFGWDSDKRMSPLLRAWHWLRTFIYSSNSTGSTPSSSSQPASTDDPAPMPSNSIESPSDSSNLASSTLSSIYERRISGSPRTVVLSTRHNIFSDGEGDEITWLPNAQEGLTVWAKKKRGLQLYLITQCQDDSSEQRVRSLLQQASIPGLDPERALFCSTSAGLQHMARQISPDLYIDSSVDNVAAGEKWGKQCLLLGSDFPQAYPDLYHLVISL